MLLGRVQPFLKQLLSPVILVLIWEASVRLGFVDSEFLPSPGQILQAMREMGAAELLPELAATLFRIAIGFFIAAVVGVLLGSWMAISSRANGFFYPILASTYAIPKSSFIPLFILWFGLGFWPIVLVVFIACALPVVVYTFHGISEVPKLRVWSALSFGVSRRDLFWSVLLPAAMPEILVGMRIALGFAFTVAIAGEMIVSTTGLGKLIFSYGEGGVYPSMFAVICVLLIVAYVADLLFMAFIDYYLRWLDRGHSSGGGA
ncbi:MAG: ABC transporter permease [Rhizobiaceae bacterium]|nr:ABC transporter permease [Rhizobiaceae bacterium]